MDTLLQWLERRLGYLSLLRPLLIFAALIVLLPLTALSEHIPGHAVVGNLFVEYGFQYGFYFGLALLGAVWAVMHTVCLTLDVERDRDDTWIYDPKKHGGHRLVTSPLTHRGSFVGFTVLAIPGVVVVIWAASDRFLAGLGVLLGGFFAYMFMDFTVYLLRCGDQTFQIFPWPPLFGLPPTRRLAWIAQIAASVALS